MAHYLLINNNVPMYMNDFQEELQLFGSNVIPLFWKSPTIPHHFQNTKSHKFGNFIPSDNGISQFEQLLSELSFHSFPNSMVCKL
jgi:hypothetical protein